MTPADVHQNDHHSDSDDTTTTPTMTTTTELESRRTDESTTDRGARSAPRIDAGAGRREGPSHD